jgi:hypothetical protein
MPFEGSSGVVLWMHVCPPNHTKQCHGTCGLSKPQSEYAARQWVKPGECICLDCSHSARPLPTKRAHPLPKKQCNGPCRLSKPAAEYTTGQWRKLGGEGERKKGGHLCLDCSCSAHTKNAIELEAFTVAAKGSTVEIAFIDKNATPNFASPHRGGSPQKRESISPRGLSERTLPLLSLLQLARAPLSFASPRKGGSPRKLPLRPSLESACTLTPMKRCRRVYDGSFGSALAFAAKAYQHTACQLREMARDPDTSLKRFAHSALAKAQDSLCLPYCGMLVERADDPCHGFVFRSQPCSGVCSSGTHCSDCASQTSTALREIKQSIEPDIHRRAEKSATIQNIANNPLLAAMEIGLLRKEIRSLHCQLLEQFCRMN